MIPFEKESKCQIKLKPLKRFVKTQLAEQNYKNQLSLQISHVEMMEKKNEELRVFRHDMPKLLRPLAMYIQDGNYDDAMKIVEEFNVSIEKSRPRFSTGNYHLDTVLEAEQQLAEKYGVKITVPFGCAFPEEGIAPDDIYTIFPNALDNAVDSCMSCENKEITFISRIKGDRVFVTVSNPVSGKLHMKNGELLTTKKDSSLHGFGVRSIKKSAEKYGGSCEYAVKDGIFTLNFSLKFFS